jgi:hypothetical protein
MRPLGLSEQSKSTACCSRVWKTGVLVQPRHLLAQDKPEGAALAARRGFGALFPKAGKLLGRATSRH